MNTDRKSVYREYYSKLRHSENQQRYSQDEPAKRRPVLILQGDDFNASKLNTVICAVITSNILPAQAPPNILLEKAYSGLKRLRSLIFRK